MFFCATGAALTFYFTYEKARLERKRVTEMSKGYGKPKVGGPFELRDLEGNVFSEKELKGKYNLVRHLHLLSKLRTGELAHGIFQRNLYARVNDPSASSSSSVIL